MELDKYFQRIQFLPIADEEPLAALRRLVFAHATSIPFENVDVLLKHSISLDDEAVDHKLIDQQRGGYCFEHGSILLRVLQAMGYQAVPLSARVRYLVPREVIPPRTHLFLHVSIDNQCWLVDVGIGGLSATTPILMDGSDAEQATPHEPRRIILLKTAPFPRYLHQAKLGHDWHDVSEFTLEEMPPIDRELANWWTSAYPHSRFRQNLIVALAHRDGTRSNILNREFTHRQGSQVLERFEFRDQSHLRQVLRERYKLEWPSDQRLHVPAIDWRS